jgi:hypothetical protein
MRKVTLTAFAVGLCMTANVFLPGQVMAQVPSYVPTNGLVGWWPFNGNANDESGNGNNGTVNGATLTTDRFGNASKAYSFDGNDDWILIPNSSSFDFINLSVSFWFKSNSTSNCQTFLKQCNYLDASGELWAMSGSNSSSITTWAKYDDINCIPGIWQSSMLNISSIYNNNYHHILYLIDGSIMKTYIDGVLMDEKSNSSNQINACYGGDIQIGRNLINDLCYFNGLMDDIGIWNRALTEQEITDLNNETNLGIDNLLIKDLKIYPNPTNDYIKIDAGNLATLAGYSIKIEDAQGQQVFQNAVNQQQFYVDITTWGGNGLYFVRIIDPQGNTVDIKKIVLQ